MKKHPVRFRDLKKLLDRYGIEWESKSGKGSHGAFNGRNVVDQTRQRYPVPRDQQREMQVTYVEALRVKFGLVPENGYGDELFY